MLIENQARFNGLAETNLIGEQDARRKSLAYACGDIKLMGEEGGSSAQQTPQIEAPICCAMLKSNPPQVKVGKFAQLVVDQTFNGGVKFNVRI